MKEFDLKPLVDYLDAVETLVSPARHLPADRAGVITGGYGNINPLQVHEGMVVTEEQAAFWRDERLKLIQSTILSGLTVAPTQGQMLALIDFTYNVGIHALVNSTLWRHMKAGEFAAACDEFKKWDIADGKHLLGLAKRRHIEENWFNA